MKKLFIIGNLGKDPETLLDKNNNQYVTFTVAVTSGTKENPVTDWVSVSCSYRLADLAKTYLKKGSRVFIEGNANFSAYINKDGQAAPSIKLYASEIQFLSSKKEEEGNSYNQPSNFNGSSAEPKNTMQLTNDDIPF